MSEVRPRGLDREWWLVALLSTLAILFLAYDQTAARLDRMAYDLLLRLERHAPHPDILLVTIDDDSLHEIGPWPWPRETHARLIGAIARGGAQAIGYDVLFLEPRYGDDALARAMRAAPPLFLPVAFERSGTNGMPPDVLLPVPALADAAKEMGHANLTVDEDGLIRHAYLFEEQRERRWPHLMKLMDVVASGKRRSPETVGGLIAFAGSAGSFPTIKAASVLRGELPPELLQGRLVLVGATAQGLGDLHSTPFKLMSGLEVHANILDNLLSRRLIVESDFPARALMALTPLWLVLFSFRRLRPRSLMLVSAAVAALTMMASIGLLLIGEYWLSPITALLGLLLVYPLWGWRRLASVSAYMLAELERLRSEPDALRDAKTLPPVRGDPITRQTMLLNDAVARLRTMRLFVHDSLDQLLDAIFVVDDSGLLLLANRAAAALMAELVPQHDAKVPLTALLDRLAPASILDREGSHPNDPVMLVGQPRQLLAVDGRCFEACATRRESVDEQSSGWIVTLSDVTARWQAERQREMMMRFFTHDMRAPQVSILATLATDGGKDISGTISDRIAGYARRTLDLADGFVQLARAEALQYRLEAVNVSDILLDALDELWPQLVAAQMMVETRGEEQSLIVMAERSLLTRALINLIDNAIKYAGSGFRLQCVLERRVCDGTWTALCSISDNGPGISPEQCARLFDPFQRGRHDGRSVHENGAGLGLSFVHTVVTRHDGLVRCDSTEGQGTTFTISLPLEDSRSGA
jgi:CHASE2 domain-containing sensor protein/signal transduction histidine kinase